MSTSLSVCVRLLAMTVSPAKTVEPTQMPFGRQNRVNPAGNRALGAHWRHVENTMNDLCAAAMRPLAKLLRPSVILGSLSGDRDSL